MPLYRYKAKSKDGKRHRGVMEVLDEAALFRALDANELYCYEWSTDRENCTDRKSHIKSKAIPPLCRQMAAMLSAGVPLSEILAISCETEGDSSLKAALMDLRERVHKGQTLSEAMESMPGKFPNLLVYMIRTGEASGRLDELLKKIAGYYNREEELNGKVRTAMTYPVILMIVTFVASLFMLTVVVPQFASMLQDQRLPWITRVMMDVSINLRSHGFLLLILVLSLAAFCVGILMVPSVRLRADRTLLKIPIAGKLLKTIYTSRFASTFSVLYGSGNGILEALDLTGKTMGNMYVKRGLTEVVENLKRGETLSRSLKGLDVFEPVFISMVVAGEESGHLEDVLGDAGGYYEKEAERAINQMIALLEPSMILFMALIVGTIVLSIMIPIFTMYSSML